MADQNCLARASFLYGFGAMSLAGCAGNGSSANAPMSSDLLGDISGGRRSRDSSIDASSFPQSFTSGSQTVTIDYSGSVVSVYSTDVNGNNNREVLTVTANSSAQTLTYAPIGQAPITIDTTQPASVPTSAFGLSMNQSSSTNATFAFAGGSTGSLSATNASSGTASIVYRNVDASSKFGDGGSGPTCGGGHICSQAGPVQVVNIAVGGLGILAGVAAIAFAGPFALAAGFLALAIAVLLLFRSM